MPRSFNSESTTDQVLEGIELTGKLALVTGASSGLGVETARALAAKGARVVMAARDVAKLQQQAAAIRAKHPQAQLEVMELQLDKPASVRAFAKAFLAQHAKLSLLIGNAGVMACPLARTAEGWEMQFATNACQGAGRLSRQVIIVLIRCPWFVVRSSLLGGLMRRDFAG